MGKLNIAHHKSYHPYRRDNIERVRRDEEAARLQQLKDEGKLLMAVSLLPTTAFDLVSGQASRWLQDSEARLDVLRKRSSASRRRRDPSPGEQFGQPAEEATPDELTTPEGHINFFSTAGVSQTSSLPAEVERKISEREAEQGVALAPNPKDIRPWYMAVPAQPESPKSPGDPESSAIGSNSTLRRKARDTHQKVLDDPLTAIRAQLRQRDSSSQATQPLPSTDQRSHRGKRNTAEEPLRVARLSREAVERARAEALIRARNERVRSDAGSSMGADTPRSSYGYGDVYNRLETQEAGFRRKSRGHHWRNEDYSGRSQSSNTHDNR
ncbi:hypothetical protein FRC01_004788 [Tulasnella sp. 417]|nr:hypothetical protein FRC01_004788 [Tulasnella sp. 417]